MFELVHSGHIGIDEYILSFKWLIMRSLLTVFFFNNNVIRF